MNTLIIFIAILLIVIAVIVGWKFRSEHQIAFSAIIIVILIIGFSWYLTSTEGGKRKVKDFTSDVSGGITRHVRVYDFNGKLIEEYQGTFDIETTNDNYILFDDENNLRHIIYFTTGTVIIDELGQ